MDNNTKEKFDETVKKVQEKAKTTTGKIVIAVIVVIILFNTMWTVMDGKVAGHIEALKKEFQAQDDLGEKIAPFEQRLAALEGRSIDLDAVKSDVETIKQATESFETKLNAMIKAEEEKLESLTKDMESHKAYLERLKGLLAGEN